ncbi:MAG TPA: flagellar hook-associated protein 3 [Gammaproteobacteria bacterium]|nr:flagellar hook-associated protein 3 [Gammaproteobacteria bacterium]
MRVSTRQYQQIAIDGILDRQRKLSKTQQQMVTGKRVLSPADDPVAATRIHSFKESIDILEQYQANASQVKNRLGLEESTLKGVVDTIQRVRELAVAGANGSLSDAGRQSIAKEVYTRLDALLGLANTMDANGEYLFGGNRTGTMPFSRSGTAFLYHGDDGQRRLQIGPDFSVANSDSGSDVFMRIRNGNRVFATGFDPANSGTATIDQGRVDDITAYTGHEYTITFPAAGQVLVTDDTLGTPVAGFPQPFVDGQEIPFDGIAVTISGAPATGSDSFTVKPSSSQDIFTTVQRLADALNQATTSPADEARTRMEISASIAELDNALDHFLNISASIGSRLNSVEGQEYMNEDTLVNLKQVLSNLEDLDYAEAVGRLNLQMTGMEAAQQVYLKAQGLSLFDFMR